MYVNIHYNPHDTANTDADDLTQKLVTEVELYQKELKIKGVRN